MSYSTNVLGKTGTDGVLRDVNGEVIPQGLDEDTKAELQRQIDGPRVRILPSDNDILTGNVSGFGASSAVYVNPNDSEAARKLAFEPGYIGTDGIAEAKADTVSTPEDTKSSDKKTK